MATALVIENDPNDDARRLGEWLTDAGLELATLRPHAGDAIPEDLADYQALVVLGGPQHVYDDPGTPGNAWLPACESLLRHAVRHRVPTLAVCLGAQMLATAHGGTVAPAAAGPHIGPVLVARRDAATDDPLFARVPFLPDVIAWHHDEITELPVGAVLLASATDYPHQAFRMGPAAWGMQFHIEPDAEMIAGWAEDNRQVLAELGRAPQHVTAAAAEVMDDLWEVWQPVAARFAALARGELAMPSTDLPLLGH